MSNYPNQEEGIIAFANMMKADMIAIGTHGRKGFTHWVFGSKADDVVNHGQKPIWTTLMADG